MGMLVVLVLLTCAGRISAYWPCPVDLPCYCDDPNRYSLRVIPENQGKELKVICFDQGFKEVPRNLPHSVTYLDLDLNDISVVKNNTFVAFTNLTFLRLSFNPLTTIEYNAFQGLTSLNILAIANCPQTENNEQCKYDSHAFSPLVNLQQLYVTSNKCFPLEALDFFPNLTGLGLSISAYATTLPAMLRNLRHLEILFIDGGARLVPLSLNPHFLQPLNSLPISTLVFSYYNITDVSKDAFLNIKKLQVLGFRDTQLHEAVAVHLGRAISKFKKIGNLFFRDCDSTVYQIFSGMNVSTTITILEVSIVSKFNGQTLNPLPDFSYLTPNLEQFIYNGPTPNMQFLCDLGLQAHPTLQQLQIAPLRYRKMQTSKHVEKYRVQVAKERNPQVKPNSSYMPNEPIKCTNNILPPNLDYFDASNNPEFFYGREVKEKGLIVHHDLKNLIVAPNSQFINYISLYCLPNVSIHCFDVSFNSDFSLTFFKSDYTNCSWNLLSNFKLNSCQMQNKFTDLHIEDEMSGFQTLSGLHRLDMGNNEISDLPENFFLNQTNMIVLNISDNKLSSFDPDLSHMYQLQILDLAFNYLPNLYPKTRKMLYKMTNTRSNSTGPLKVYLEGNPLFCSCKCLDFILWLTARQSSMLFFDYDAMHCVTENGSHVSMGNISWILNDRYYTCTDYDWISDSAIFAAIVNLAHIVSSVLYRLKWDIKYLWHKYKQKKKTKYEVMKPKQCYAFDAFVIFAYEDVDWVKEHMIPIMEEQAGFHLCVHLRDFPPGYAVIDNVSAAFEFSKIAVIVLTNNFLQRPWCMYELEIAQSLAVTRGNGSVIVIKMEELEKENVPTTLAYLLSTQTYLEREEDPKTQKVFWQKLKTALSIEFPVA